MADDKKIFSNQSIRDEDGGLHHAGSVLTLSAKRAASLVKARYAKYAGPKVAEVEGKCPEGCKEVHKNGKGEKDSSN